MPAVQYLSHPDLQSTHETGILALDYGYCLHAITPQNDSMGTKLLFGMSKAVH
jgi:hypothetical protein